MKKVLTTFCITILVAAAAIAAHHEGAVVPAKISKSELHSITRAFVDQVKEVIGYLIDKSAEDIYKMCVGELIKCTKLEESDFSQYKVLKEKRATFISSNKIINTRPSSKTKITNLFLAGDWTDTGLPSTIEGAVKSGRITAELISTEW